MADALSAQGITAENGIGWADEFRIGLCGSVRGILAPRGVKVRQKVQLDRDWYDLAVVVDVRKGRLYWAWLEGTKDRHIVLAVEQWHKDGFDALVWDGSGGHRGKCVKATEMVVVEQPPVSPELNPAERVGEEIRAYTEGRIYESIYQKMAAAEIVLNKLSADPEAVKRLTGWDWIIQSCRNLPHKE